MLNSPHLPIPQLCPLWSADFRALQTEHTNLTAEAQNLLQETLSQQTTNKEKSEALEPIAKKIEALAEKLESAYQKIYPHHLSPEQREFFEKDLLPKYEAWIKASHLNEEPISPELNPNFKGFNLLQLDETTNRYFYEGGKIRESADEELADSPETIALYKKFAGRRFYVPTPEELIARIKRGLATIQAMKHEYGEISLSFACIGNSIRANVDVYNAELDKLSLPGVPKLNPASIDDKQLADREVNEGINKYFGDWEFDEGSDQMKMTGGMSKEELIEKCQGFLLSVVPVVEVLPPNPDPGITYGVTKNITILKKDLEKIKESEGRPLCPEEHLAQQMLRLTEQKVIENESFTGLLGVNNITISCFSYGYWSYNRYRLSRGDTNRHFPILRLRPSATIF